MFHWGYENEPFKRSSEGCAAENDVQATVQSMMTVIDLKGAAGREAPCWREHSPQLNNKSQPCRRPATATTYQKGTMTTYCKYLVPHSCVSWWDPTAVVIYLAFLKEKMRRWMLFVYDELRAEVILFEFIQCKEITMKPSSISPHLHTPPSMTVRIKCPTYT